MHRAPAGKSPAGVGSGRDGGPAAHVEGDRAAEGRAILADEVGLGKTYVALAVMAFVIVSLGVLVLTLHPDFYDWTLLAADGTVLDSVTADCH